MVPILESLALLASTFSVRGNLGLADPAFMTALGFLFLLSLLLRLVILVAIPGSVLLAFEAISRDRVNDLFE